MAKIGTGLDTNDTYPEMELHLLSGETIQVPQYTGDGYGVFLVYRGHW